MAGTGSRQRIGHPGVNIRCSLSVSENFQNGYLYISDTGIPASEFGGYGPLDYMLSNPYQDFVGTFADCFSIKGQALLPIDADGALAYAAILSRKKCLHTETDRG